MERGYIPHHVTGHMPTSLQKFENVIGSNIIIIIFKELGLELGLRSRVKVKL